MEGRRTLRFDRMSEIMPEVDRLLHGYQATGNWSLGQICHHLKEPIRRSVEGFPGSAPWIIRATVGRLLKRRILGRGVMPDGVKLPKAFEPRPNLDDRAEVESLRAAIALLEQHAGPMPPHPVLGHLSPDE